MTYKVPTVVLTGGPCAGKTTALARIADYLVSMGRHPIIVPETATLIIQMGFKPQMDAISSKSFQSKIIDFQLFIENQAQEMAQTLANLKPVIVLDRGILDARAYTEEKLFSELLSERALDEDSVREGRYDAVLFLRSAANGAEFAYTKANNAARRESVEEAKDADMRTLDAWNGHSKLRIIENEPGKTFEHKMDQVLVHLSNVLGVPVPLEFERRFLLKTPVTIPSQIKVRRSLIEQSYLCGHFPDGSERVRKRSYENATLYFHTRKEPRGDGSMVEYERAITKHEYHAYLTRKDTKRREIRKFRSCFAIGGYYYELDEFVTCIPERCILEIELSSLDAHCPLPPFVTLDREVTHDKTYSNASLALL